MSHSSFEAFIQIVSIMQSTLILVISYFLLVSQGLSQTTTTLFQESTTGIQKGKDEINSNRIETDYPKELTAAETTTKKVSFYPVKQKTLPKTLPNPNILNDWITIEKKALNNFPAYDRMDDYEYVAIRNGYQGKYHVKPRHLTKEHEQKRFKKYDIPIQLFHDGNIWDDYDTIQKPDEVGTTFNQKLLDDYIKKHPLFIYTEDLRNNMYIPQRRSRTDYNREPCRHSNRQLDISRSYDIVPPYDRDVLETVSPKGYGRRALDHTGPFKRSNYYSPVNDEIEHFQDLGVGMHRHCLH